MGKNRARPDFQPNVIPTRTAGKIASYEATLQDLQGLPDVRAPEGSRGYAMNLLGVPAHARELTTLVAAPLSTIWGEVRRRALQPRIGSGSASNALRFASWHSDTVGTFVTTAGCHYLTPYALRVLRIMIQIENDPGATSVAVHSNLNAVALESVTLSPGAGVSTVYPFTALSSLNAGDLLSVGYDPTNARTANEVQAMAVEVQEEVPYAA